MFKASIQTSANRRSKKEPQLKKKPEKIIPKSLIPDFDSTDDVSELQRSSVSTETFEVYPDSIEKTETIQYSADSTESFGSTPQSAEKSETVENSPMSVVESTVTVTDLPNSDSYLENIIDGVDDGKYGIVASSTAGNLTGDFEVQLIVDLLQQARLQISNAATVDNPYKKIIDAVIKTVVEDCHGSAEGRKPQSELELVWLKVRIGLFCCFMWIILVLVILRYKTGPETDYLGPPPT